MASSCSSGFDDFRSVPKTAPEVVGNPPFGWVIMDRKERGVVSADRVLPVFTEWLDAQNFISCNGFEGFSPKLLFWDVIVEKFKGEAREVVLDYVGNQDYYVHFPLQK